jgi:hypothetical protein
MCKDCVSYSPKVRYCHFGLLQRGNKKCKYYKERKQFISLAEVYKNKAGYFQGMLYISANIKGEKPVVYSIEISPAKKMKDVILAGNSIAEKLGFEDYEWNKVS